MTIAYNSLLALYEVRIAGAVVKHFPSKALAEAYIASLEP